MKISTETLYRLCNKYQCLQAAIARNMKNYLRETDKEQALKRLQRLSGFAQPLMKKNKY